MSRLLVVFALAAMAGCSDHALDLDSPESALLQQGQLVKPNEVNELDALVREINGFDSAPTFEAHDRDYRDDVDSRFVEVEGGCWRAEVNEHATRLVTRSRSDERLRKLVLTWTSSPSDLHESWTTYEAYHYDRAGALRVVVVDRETNHQYDEAFMKVVDAHNEEVTAAIARMPKQSEPERVAILQKSHEMRRPVTIAQHRVYYRRDGTPFYETRRDGLEQALAADYPDIPRTPPKLYGSTHPANVSVAPYLLALSPSPRYSARPLPETWVAPAEPSIRAELIAASPYDGELSLRTPPVCR